MSTRAISTRNENDKVSYASDFAALLSIAALLIIDYLPYNQTMEIINPQFRYLSGLNIFLGIYCYLTQKKGFGFFSIFKKNYISIIYIIFILLCSISVFSAKNSSLVITKITQILIVFCLFINLTLILKDKLHLLHKIIFIVCISAFCQSAQEFIIFIKDSRIKSVIEALDHLKGNTGNINILAASLTIKVPFLLIGITHFSKFKRVFLCFTLLLTLIVIFLTGARTPFLSLSSICVIYFIYYLKENSYSRSSFLKTALLIFPIIAAIFIVNLFFKETKDNGRYVSLQNRAKQISTDDASASARIVFWKNAIQITKKNPVLGIGLGNYQIESIPYERLTANDSNLSLHAHNDFLEITAETGILNGIIYFSLFVLIVFINLKRVLKSEDKIIQNTAILSLMIAVVYGFDSLFNFPMYRPTMQIFFCLLLALTIVNKIYIDESPEKKNRSIVLIFLIIFNTVLCYSASLINKASNLEYLIQTDDINANMSGVLNGNEVIRKLPNYPNIFSTSEPFYEYAGIYYLREKKYDKALNCFAKADKINPYLGRTSFYKNIISMERGNVDSAYIYSKQAFYLRPRNSNFFRTALKIAAMKTDTLEILKEHQIFTKYRNSPEAWITAGNALENAGFSRNKLIDFINKGAIAFPKDSTLLKKKNDFLITNFIIKGQDLESKGDFVEALKIYEKGLKIDSQNVYVLQNIGFWYFNRGDNKKAIEYLLKALSFPGLNGGKTEFILSLCYKNANDIQNACKYFALSKSMNYSQAQNQNMENCP